MPTFLISDFKINVINGLFECSKFYLELMKNIYVIRSDGFVFREQYLFRFYKRNFLHLTGVNTALSAEDFFDRCVNETLLPNDFDCESTRELKSKVKDKLSVLPFLGSTFLTGKTIEAQERFSRGHVQCAIATSDGILTVCFDGKEILWPKSFQKKNRLTKGMTVPVSVIEIIPIVKFD